MKLLIAALLALPLVALPGTGALAQGGEYVDGKKHGHWVLRFADGTVQEGPLVDGTRYGHWVERSPDGEVYEGPYLGYCTKGEFLFVWT